MLSLKRKVNEAYDQVPSIGHYFNSRLVKRYLKRGDRVLDVGCWTGQLKLAIDRKEYSYYGVDINSKAIAKARRNNPKAIFKVASALRLPFPDSYFNIVSLFDVLEHLPQRSEEVCLREIKRVMGPRGKFILSTPADNFFSKLLDPAYFLIGHRHYKLNKLTSMYKRTGLVTIKRMRIGGIYFMSLLLIQMVFKHLLGGKAPNSAFFRCILKKAEEELKNEKGCANYYLIAAAE